MKIRTGFVSNSSSSSFCILGVVLNQDLMNIAKTAAENINKNREEEYWCCTKCGYEPSNPVKFCEDCGSPMGSAKRIVWKGDYEPFYVLDMEYYKQTNYGNIAGYSVSDKGVDDIIKLQKDLIKIFGPKTNIIVMSGESSSIT